MSISSVGRTKDRARVLLLYLAVLHMEVVKIRSLILPLVSCIIKMTVHFIPTFNLNWPCCFSFKLSQLDVRTGIGSILTEWCSGALKHIQAHSVALTTRSNDTT